MLCYFVIFILLTLVALHLKTMMKHGDEHIEGRYRKAEFNSNHSEDTEHQKVSRAKQKAGIHATAVSKNNSPPEII